jgi:DnaK suppressor protein
LNKKDRERYRKKLLKKKDEIVSKISETYNESKEVESGIAPDVVDKAESSYTKEFLLSLSSAEREQLRLIDEALERIDKNEFGICQSCGKTISKKRLDIVPWTPYCIDCQQKEEEEESS